MTTWSDAPPPPPARLTLRGWLRVLRRGAPIVLLLVVAFPLLLLLRGPEKWIWGEARPVTPRIQQAFCIATCRLMGVRRHVRGAPSPARGAYVANHASWLDIFVLNASKRVFFVAKSEVAGWPVIGWLARGTGTVFIRRDRRDARRQQAILTARLRAGHHLLFFPEGTSTDGQRVLPFKTTLFAAFTTEALRDFLTVQPVSLRYHAPAGEDPRFYGWWGDMGFAQGLLKVLAARRQGRVEVVYHPPLPVADYPDRKALATACEAAVRKGFIEAAR
ncbi:1-acyl-sn-glycerol-3-phosphate acyltransferase [Rhodobacteraceae bacterium W635]|uniref:lysophospholipid acyltransferase family protein n=1 Tax=Nioella halotolerans TaxID=2303578 RepID=UPI000E3B69A7|nr:1-acyl-sn-glycerol-3-phosphate acyltransferase [Rhodobacteraceae bacterium W635]